MDEVNEKVIECLNDLLDAIKVETDTIVEMTNTHDEDTEVSETILNLTTAVEKLFALAKS